MSYRYLETITYADVAFQAEGKTLEELFQSAAEALMHIMIEDLNSIQPKSSYFIQLKEHSTQFDDGISHLLCEFLQKFIYWKDVDQVFLRTKSIQINQDGSTFNLLSEASGEKINSSYHSFGNDIKAVTYHHLKVWKENQTWLATVVVDT